jgi:hypothetical protein
MDEKASRLTLHHQGFVLAKKCADSVHLVAPEHTENVAVPLGKWSQDDPFQSVKNENWIAGQISTMLCTSNNIEMQFDKWHFRKFVASLCSVLTFDRVTLHIVEAAENCNVTEYCLLSSTAHQILIRISHCSDASNTPEMKKCPVTQLNNKCSQLQNYDIQKSPPLRGMKLWRVSYFDLMKKKILFPTFD